MNLPRTFSFTFCALIVIACSGTGDVILSDSGASTDGMKACNDQASASCTLRDRCSNSYNTALNYGDSATCQTRSAIKCFNELTAAGTNSDPTLIEACAAAYPTEACTDFFDNNPVAACVATSGSFANGAACGENAQCSSTYCAIAFDAICGTCQAMPIAGDSCQPQPQQPFCGRDLACETPTVTAGDAGAPSSKCAAWVTAGGACLTGYAACQEGLACVGDNTTTMTMGTCQAAVATLNAPCDGLRQTMPNCLSELGLVCIQSTSASAIGTCQAFSLVGAGETCGAIGSHPITAYATCKAGGLCKKAHSTDASGTCVAPAADGTPCDNDPSVGPPCLSPAKCVVNGSGTAGTCTLPNVASCK